MSESYNKEIVRLVTEAATTMPHRKVLEPLLNMVASVLAGIKVENDVDDRQVMYAQTDKFFDKYVEAYRAQRIDKPESAQTH